MNGSTRPTPSTAAIVSASSTETGSRADDDVSPKAIDERTSRSMPSLICANRSSNVFFRLSASTNDPTTNATPARIEIAIAIVRPRRARMLLRARSVVVPNDTSVPEPLHSIEHLLGGRTRQLVDDPPVGQEDDVVGIRGGDGIVRHHHDRLSVLSNGL